MKRFISVVTTLASFQADAASAQSSVEGDGRYSVVGVVVDSVRGRRLSGADVTLEGTPYVARTDSIGMFRIDSVKQGTYRIGFYHPFLDSLSLSVGTRRLDIPDKSGLAVLLAIPSATTIVRAMCPAAPPGSSVIAGRVLDPDSEAPISGANVSLSWIEFEVTKSRRLTRTGKETHATSDGAGAYRICDLPSDLDGSLKASNGSASTSLVPVSTSTGPLVVRSLILSPRDSATAALHARLRGVVRASTGENVSGATVTVTGTQASTTTDLNGSFSLGGLTAGTRNIVARRIGFIPAIVPVDLTSRGSSSIDIVLEKYTPALALDTVFVRARRDRALEQVGFIQRRRAGLGDYMTRADFERRNPRVLSDLLRGMRGVQVNIGPDGKPVVVSSRGGGGCVIISVDGVQIRSRYPGDIDDMVYPHEISAVEVYSGIAIPANLESVHSRGCLTIVIWTAGKIGDVPR